jgi:YebC/PmpR family DNA-binding regulatory protein
MAGHSKWKQIKHKKAAADAKRGALFGKMARAITNAVRAAHGDENATSVQGVLERARAADMPKDNIERAIEKGQGIGAAQMETLLFELFAPGGVACLIIAITDSRNRTVQELKHLLSEYECSIGLSGSALWAFEKKHDGTYHPFAPQLVEGEAAEALDSLLEDLYEREDIDSVYVARLEV